ncbi:GntR family transcriptional regulator [Georgenia alba]|uniref:GntR family transcriptional regulator n=1 Tax=Georgenia alba TaxID=2233858 RepID=A0ABW2Q9M2_9MICO
MSGTRRAAAPAIDRSSNVPLYRQLEEALRSEIEQGAYRPGDMLPSESEICARYQLSRSVVRQALQHLAQAGTVRTERGRGSFVAEPKLSERFVQRATGFYDDLTRMGMRVETRVVYQALEPVPREVREFLGVNEAVRIDRVRSVEGRVLAYVRTYLASERCPGLERFDLTDRSLYAHLRDVYGLHVHSGFRTVEAVAAEADVAERLGLERGSPVLLLCSASRTSDGRPLEWFAAWHRADRTRFQVDIVAGSEWPFEQAVVVDDGAPIAASEPAPTAGDEVTDRVVAVVRAPEGTDSATVAAELASGSTALVELAIRKRGS